MTPQFTGRYRAIAEAPAGHPKGASRERGHDGELNVEAVTRGAER